MITGKQLYFGLWQGTFLWGIAGAIFAVPVAAVGILLSKYLFGRFFFQ